MANDNRLVAEQREKFGKGAARKLRAAGKIPAVLYGHGTEPQHLTLPGHEVMLILRKANAVLELDISGANQLALVKDVQKDPVRQIIEHVDLVVIRAGERVTVDIPLDYTGMLARDVERAKRWRFHTREIFTRYFTAGYRVVDFALLRDQWRGRYLLTSIPPVE